MDLILLGLILGLATLGLTAIAWAFGSAKLIARAAALAYGLTLLGLATALTAIHRSFALALGSTAFSHSLASGLALHAFATLSA